MQHPQLPKEILGPASPTSLIDVWEVKDVNLVFSAQTCSYFTTALRVTCSARLNHTCLEPLLYPEVVFMRKPESASIRTDNQTSSNVPPVQDLFLSSKPGGEINTRGSFLFRSEMEADDSAGHPGLFTTEDEIPC